jgi:CheY-like chemotaxis protein
VDDMRLVQVFNNLLSNALKFTTEGFIKIKAVCKKRYKRYITVTFSVEDSGIGINKADQEMIFESFWQVYDESTKQLTGTGLGLTICTSLLHLMGSALTLESEKGKGSKFSFDLTLDYSGKPVLTPDIDIRTAGDLTDIRVLLVEDNKINMIVAKKILIGFKAIVDCAYDGKEALDQMAIDPDFQVVLLDLEMPGMNGYTAIYEMKKLYPQIPVIALTASLVDQQMFEDLLASGFNDCIVKPFQPHQLLSRIQRHL